MQRIFVASLVVALVFAALVFSTPPAAASSESGVFPDRSFAVTKSPGSGAHGDSYRTSMTPAYGGQYSILLDELEGTAVIVDLYRVQDGTLVLMAEAKLRSPVQVFGPQQLLSGTRYEISLAVQGKPGLSFLHEQYVSTVPSACFTFLPAAPLVGGVVAFDAACTSDVDNNIVGYAWDFGDGGSAAGAQVSHTFQSESAFAVSLAVTDALGDVGRSRQTVRVTSPSPGFRPPFTDYGVDWDSDGYYDVLRVDVGIYSPTNANYILDGTLYAASPHTAAQDLGLSAGVHSIGMEFDGLTLRLDGFNGSYEVTFDLYTEGGIHMASASYTTGSYRSTDFQPAPAVLAPPHTDTAVDADADGLYDFLAVDVNLAVTQPVMVSVLAMLYHADVSLLMNVTSEARVNPGTATVRVVFDALQLNRTGVDGPYVVWISLSAYWRGRWTQVDYAAHTTAAYRAADFKGTPAHLIPPYEDGGSDLDGDGLYDGLVITVPMLLDRPLELYVEGTLEQASTHAFVASTATSGPEGTGLLTGYLWFRGVEIWRSALDGPYLVLLRLRDFNGTVLDEDNYLTSAYAAAQFDVPGAKLSPPHSDYGSDTDGDGLYDELVVEVNVAAVDTVQVYLFGVLSPSIGPGYAENRSALSVGSYTLLLRFNGVELNLTGYDGSYQIVLGLYDDLSGGALDSASYTTRPYVHTQFEEPPARLGSGSTVAAADADGNGLFESLDGYMVVDVAEAGWYRLEMFVLTSDPSRSAAIITERWLGTGIQTITLSVSGVTVRSFGVDGPYTVSLWLETAFSGLTLGNAWLATPAYGYLDFE